MHTESVQTFLYGISFYAETSSQVPWTCFFQEEELRLSGDPKFSHLHDDLHVEITAFAPPAEAHARIAYALADVRRFLVPVRITITHF